MRYIDFLAHMEPILRKALQPDTKLQVRRVGPQEVRITYASPVHLCPVVEGVILGAAREYGASSSANQSQCLLRGDPECVFEVRIQARA